MDSSFKQESSPYPSPLLKTRELLKARERNGLTQLTPLQQMICSSSGALVTSCFTTPLDVIKVRLQAQEKMSLIGKRSFQLHHHPGNLLESLCLCTHCSNHLYTLANKIQPVVAMKPHITRSARVVFANIVKREGISSLWSGLPATLLMAVPATVVYFTAYDCLKYKLGYIESDPSTIYIPVLAGCLARVCAATLISPLELVRTKMQSTRLSYRELCTAMRVSIHNNGLLFLMRGLGPSLLRDVPFSAIYWLGYESTKGYYMRHYGTGNPRKMVTFLGGAVSGTIAAVLTLPFDVVKTHRQIELGEAAVHQHKKLTSTWIIIAELYRRRGISALFAGIAPRVIKVAPACAIMITIYESGKSFFRNRNDLIQNSKGISDMLSV